LQVDCVALAEALGYKHPGSVANKILKMKKKYKLNLSATVSSPRKADMQADKQAIAINGAGPKVSVTPSKNRVTKSTRGRAIVKKTPTKKPSYKYDDENGDEEVDDAKENAGDGVAGDTGGDFEADKENLQVESDFADEA
jgi:hypothetical protein